MKKAIKFRILQLGPSAFRLEYRRYFQWHSHALGSSIEECEHQAKNHFLNTNLVKTFWVFTQ